MNDEFITNCYQIISNFDESKILLKKIDNKFYLPLHRFDLASEIFEHMKKETGLDTIFLYSVDFKFLENGKGQDIINLSIADEIESKNDYYWVDINNLGNNFVHFNLIEKWLNETRLKKFSIPWFNKNWFKETKVYIISTLELNDYKILGEVKQYYLSSISCILKVETDHGFVYIKKVLSPVFKNEPLFTQKMAEYSPKYFPEIIFIDNENGFIFTKDFGENVLSKSNDINDLLNTVKSYAKLQISMINNSFNLISHNMPDRSLNKLSNQLKDILITRDRIFLDEENCITTNDINKLLDNFKKIEDLISKLENYNIPQTIEHGDLHSYNISIKDKNIIFYDWADCSISHPFISMRVFFHSIFDQDGKIRDKSKNFNNVQDSYELLVSAYLSEWNEYGTKENLRIAFDLAKKISYISFFIQFTLLVDSMEKHTKSKYKGHIYGGFKNILSFL
ncbi:MAG: hypothetical protein AABZ74_10145 [Cyanobacteriota bacterium]